MRSKILTVDDSKTVRIIVRKAFKAFDCDIVEAANGVEGLAAAAKESPDLILLDITMPVMDGVEMLTKLKADPALKAIPVIMLTAEGGREQVLRIAKIGVRDYVVKPFKEEVLVEKAGRIIELKPVSEAGTRVRSILDPADILVVDDKPAIIAQVQEGLKHTPWRIHGASTAGEAVDVLQKTNPDLVLVSLSLPDEGAFTLFRVLRGSVKTKFTPVFALVVKTALAEQQQAQQVGFTAIVTKPIDFAELEARMARSMNLDTSLRYFAFEGDALLLRLPENAHNPAILNEVAGYMKGKIADAVDSGLSRTIIDVSRLREIDMQVIKLLFQYMQTCSELAVQYVLVGNASVAQACRGFEDTRNWTFHESMEQAQAAFGRAPAAVPA